jgi:hypothetical protein
MPSVTESESSTGSSYASTECKVLLDVATKDLFRKNAFRITGLPVDATARDIGKHAEKLKVLAELGQDAQPNAAFPLRPSPTLEDVRDAIQRLKDPEKRLIDEFFWFWPENFGGSRSDAAIQALEKGDLDTATDIWKSKRKHPTEGIVATHNLALIYHIAALDWENHSLRTEIDAKRREEVTEYWKAAFYRWNRILADEQLWEKVLTRIRQLNEPNLTSGFARRMRTTLPAALVKVNAELALDFAEAGKSELARFHTDLMDGTSESKAHVAKIAELVLTPGRKRIQERVRKAIERGNKDPSDAVAAARELLEQARGTLFLFDLFISKNADFRNDAFDEVAEACNRLQVMYHKATNDNETCLEFLKIVLPFAASQEVREQIEKNIAALKGVAASKKLEPIYGLLKSIQDSKDLPTERLKRFQRDVVAAIETRVATLTSHSDEWNELLDSAAIVLRNISLDAWNKHQDEATAAAANLLALRYASTAELKRRLAEDKITLTQNITQHRAHRRKNVVLRLKQIAALIFAVVIVRAFFSSNSSSSNRSSSARYSESSNFASGNSGGTSSRQSAPSTGSTYVPPTQERQLAPEGYLFLAKQVDAFNGQNLQPGTLVRRLWPDRGGFSVTADGNLFFYVPPDYVTNDTSLLPSSVRIDATYIQSAANTIDANLRRYHGWR